MTTLLQWVTDEVTCVPKANLFKVVLPKELPQGEDINEDILLEPDDLLHDNAENKQM